MPEFQRSTPSGRGSPAYTTEILPNMEMPRSELGNLGRQAQALPPSQNASLLCSLADERMLRNTDRALVPGQHCLLSWAGILQALPLSGESFSSTGISPFELKMSRTWHLLHAKHGSNGTRPKGPSPAKRSNPSLPKNQQNPQHSENLEGVAATQATEMGFQIANYGTWAFKWLITH